MAPEPRRPIWSADTLPVSQLDLTARAECVRLEAANEKNRAGSTIPLRADLAEELRQWIAERKLAAKDKVFTVPAGLRRILDRDMKSAGIPKRDERGRTVDVHAMRTTFGTMLSTTGTAPRTAQAAMRHSDIRLTMGTDTDAGQLDVRQALEKLPIFPPATGRKQETPGIVGRAVDSSPQFVPTNVPVTGVKKGHFEALAVTKGTETDNSDEVESDSENSRNHNEKSPADIS